MFTGIVEELGTVKNIKKGANSAVFTIQAEKILDDLKTGDSVAVNGIFHLPALPFPSLHAAPVKAESAQNGSMSRASHLP